MKAEALKVIITNNAVMDKAIHASDAFDDAILIDNTLKRQPVVNDSLGG
jgi:hypothetical protein